MRISSAVLLMMTSGISFAQPAVAPPTAAPAPRFGSAAAPARPAGTIRLAAYNIENLFDDRDDPALKDEHEDKDLVKPAAHCVAAAAAIRAADADVLAVAEIESVEALTWFRDTYLQGLGYDHVAAIDAGDPRGIEQGVLSRFPIAASKNWVGTKLDKEHEVIPRSKPDIKVGDVMEFARSPLAVDIEVPGAKSGGAAYALTLVVVHQKASGDSSAWREAEARKIVELIRGLEAERPGRNIALLGDFNAQPYDDSVLTYTSGGLVDIFAARDLDQPKWITHASGRVIDNIFANAALAAEIVPGSAFVLGTPTRAEGLDYRKTPPPAGYASDHFPVVVDVKPVEAPAAPTKP